MTSTHPCKVIRMRTRSILRWPLLALVASVAAPAIAAPAYATAGDCDGFPAEIGRAHV